MKVILDAGLGRLEPNRKALFPVATDRGEDADGGGGGRDFFVSFDSNRVALIGDMGSFSASLVDTLLGWTGGENLD